MGEWRMASGSFSSSLGASASASANGDREKGVEFDDLAM